MLAAYLPQLRCLRKATTGNAPSMDGLSAYYIFFHGIFCNSLLSYAYFRTFSVDELDLDSLTTFAVWLGLMPIFAQWFCAMSIVAIYVIGRTKQFGDKVLIPVLLIVHAVFNLDALSSVSASDLGSTLAGYILMMGVAASMPFVVVLQAGAQYWEMKKAKHLRAFSLRSSYIQAAVVSVLVARLCFEIHRDSLCELRDSSSDEHGFQAIIGAALECYLSDLVPFNYIFWVAGASTVWYHTRTIRAYQAEKKG